jgi:hypothetical protein
MRFRSDAQRKAVFANMFSRRLSDIMHEESILRTAYENSKDPESKETLRRRLDYIKFEEIEKIKEESKKGITADLLKARSGRDIDVYEGIDWIENSKNIYDNADMLFKERYGGRLNRNTVIYNDILRGVFNRSSLKVLSENTFDEWFEKSLPIRDELESESKSLTKSDDISKYKKLTEFTDDDIQD